MTTRKNTKVAQGSGASVAPDVASGTVRVNFDYDRAKYLNVRVIAATEDKTIKSYITDYLDKLISEHGTMLQSVREHVGAA